MFCSLVTVGDDIEAPSYSPMTRDTVEVMETDNDAQESLISHTQYYVFQNSRRQRR